MKGKGVHREPCRCREDSMHVSTPKARKEGRKKGRKEKEEKRRRKKEKGEGRKKKEKEKEGENI
jgi:hypothetical protein